MRTQYSDTGVETARGRAAFSTLAARGAASPGGKGRTKGTEEREREKGRLGGGRMSPPPHSLSLSLSLAIVTGKRNEKRR